MSARQTPRTVLSHQGELRLVTFIGALCGGVLGFGVGPLLVFGSFFLPWEWTGWLYRPLWQLAQAWPDAAYAAYWVWCAIWVLSGAWIGAYFWRRPCLRAMAGR